MILGLFKKKQKTEQRAINFPSGYNGLFGGITGEDFDPLSIPAVNQAVEVIASSIASLPLRCAKNKNVNALLNNPNPEQTSYDFVNTIMRSLLEDGNAYIEKQYKNGVITGLVAHHYSRVSLERIGFGYRYRYTDTFGRMTVFLSHEIIHIRHNSKDKWIGESSVNECARSIEIALNQGVHAKSYLKNNARPNGVLQSDQTFGDDTEAFNRMRDSWNNSHKGADKSGKIALLEYGFKFQAMQHNMIESDYVKLFQLTSVEEVSRIFNISPIFLNDYRYSTYTNSVEANRTFLSKTLRPWLILVESVINKAFELPESQQIAFDTAPLLRMNEAERFDSYKVAIDSGFLTVDEVREREGLDKLPASLANPSGAEQEKETVNNG